MAQLGSMFENGVPRLHAVVHENLMYPGSVGDWERGPNVHNGERTRNKTVNVFFS